MVRLRLQRYGSKHRPVFRLVAADIRAPRDGRFIEVLGSYNSTSLKGDFQIKEERVRYWLDKGAQPSDAVLGLLRRQGIVAAAAQK